MSNSTESNLNQIFLSQLGPIHSSWLYDMYIQSNNYAFIHMPLVYLTRLRIQHELYCTAMCKFPALIGANKYLQPEIIDGAVVKFPLSNFEGFKAFSYNQITNNILILKKLFRHSISLKKWLPPICLQAEKEYLQTQKISSTKFIRLFNMVSGAIAINFSNPFVEQAFMQINTQNNDDEYFQKKVNEILWASMFSHISYYNNMLTLLKNSAKNNTLTETELLKFSREIAFLENFIGDGSKYENPTILASEIGFSQYKKPLDIKNIDHKTLTLPEIDFDPYKISNVIPDDEDYRIILLKLLRLLQVNEEFRHYWGLRVVRLFRQLAPNNDAIKNWGLKEYVEHLKK